MIALVVDEGHVVTVRGQRLIAINEVLGHALKLLAVRPIARIDRMKQRNVEIGRDQERQPDCFQVVLVLFLVAALGQLGGRLDINPGVKVGGIIDHRREVHVEFFHQLSAQGPLGLADAIRRQVGHMVPTVLAAQIRVANRKIVIKRGTSEPVP